MILNEGQRWLNEFVHLWVLTYVHTVARIWIGWRHGKCPSIMDRLRTWPHEGLAGALIDASEDTDPLYNSGSMLITSPSCSLALANHLWSWCLWMLGPIKTYFGIHGPQKTGFHNCHHAELAFDRIWSLMILAEVHTSHVFISTRCVRCSGSVRAKWSLWHNNLHLSCDDRICQEFTRLNQGVCSAKSNLFEDFVAILGVNRPRQAKWGCVIIFTSGPNNIYALGPWNWDGMSLWVSTLNHGSTNKHSGNWDSVDQWDPQRPAHEKSRLTPVP